MAASVPVSAAVEAKGAGASIKRFVKKLKGIVSTNSAYRSASAGGIFVPEFYVCDAGCDFKSINADDVVKHQLECNKFACPLSKFGCVVVGTSTQIKEHECKFAKCDQIPCEFVGDIKTVAKHKVDCEFKPVTCRYCEEVYPYHLLLEHKEKCDQEVVRCRLCNEDGIGRYVFIHYHVVYCFLGYQSTLKQWEKLIGQPAIDRIITESTTALSADGWYSKFPYNREMVAATIAVNTLRSNVLDMTNLMRKMTQMEETLKLLSEKIDIIKSESE
ncbi:MAG: hypothetical protein Hyperionvirus10_39 [Hyperionvirus sp.]|uniref:TRAF-type domain-containing protein n=1 Tax=Hyperionvirus sp. TaxID=2487770 RepID=A0A3G5ACU0_9VIRU|nr:MAG: hypothetical protein Hyperionvirus10_39 [Hyperionvirus sp.]